MVIINLMNPPAVPVVERTFIDFAYFDQSPEFLLFFFENFLRGSDSRK